MPRRRSPDPLIVTKLHRPAVDPTWVPRPRLLARLEEGLQHRVTLLSAPAGFGKTTLVAQWLGRCARPAVWVSLDERDGAPERFLRYVLASLRTAVPGLGAALDRLLRGIQVPPPAYLAEVLVADLAALAEPVVLVLDNYQAVPAEAVSQILLRLVEHQPEPLHLALLTRVDPAWPLGKWRARQWLTEVRAADLAFSREEAQAFFARRPARPLAADAVALLHQRTEGWVAGLQLAQVSLEHAEDPERFARDFSGTDRLIVDFLMTEVIGRHPPEVRDFLAVTALLDRFCAPLCDAALGDAPGRQPSRHLLEHLERENLFLVPLDHDRRWYRYHHLFQGLLLHHVPELAAPERRAVIHRRAADWFAREGLIEEALHHWIAAGDLDAAAALVGAHLRAVVDQDLSRQVLSRWLAMFPAGAERGRLPLLLAHAYKLMNWDQAGLARLLDEAEGLLRDSTGGALESRMAEFRADLDAQRALLLYWTGDVEGALRLASRALEALPTHGAGYARTAAVLYKAGGLALTGRKDEGLRVLEDAVSEAGATDPSRIGSLLFAQGAIHLYAADLASAELIALRALTTHETAPMPDYWLAHVLYLRAAVAYERNRLDEAAAEFDRVAAMRYHTSARIYLDGLIGLCLVARARADAEGVARYAAQARAYALEVGDPTTLRVVDSLDARLAVGTDGPAPAAGPPAAPDFTSLFLEVPSLTYAERLVHSPSDERRVAALAFVEQALERVNACHNVRQAIPFSLVRAMALAGRGDQEAAHSVLAEALHRAEPLGLVRTFVDRGPRLQALLEALAKEQGRGRYLATLLGACEGPAPAERLGIPASPKERDGMPPGQAGATGSGGLSLRELGVLRLLEQGFSNKEIADRLFVSLETARKHTGNIYRKLGVHKRTQAVAAARRLGLFASK